MADKILHNLPIDNNPSDSVKIAMGTETTPATNITLANFYTLLMSKLGFFKVSNYLSEVVGNLTAMAAVRNNIDVYSRGYTDMMISSKANKANVIEKDSTVAFTPTIGTHPANKKYVDEVTPRLLAWGRGNGADGSTTYQTIRNNPYISTLVFGREGTGSYVLTTNYLGDQKHIMVQIIPISGNYNETNCGAIWKRGAGVFSFLTTADGGQNDIDIEYYLWYIQ